MVYTNVSQVHNPSQNSSHITDSLWHYTWKIYEYDSASITNKDLSKSVAPTDHPKVVVVDR